MISIVCFYWGTRFAPEYVNRLMSGVRRNLQLEHRFFCITNQPEGFDPEVHVLPLWNWGARTRRCFRRLKLLSEEMRPLLGDRILLLDLDTVILDSLDPLLDVSDPVVVYRCPSTARRGYALNPSFLLFDTGALEHLWQIARKQGTRTMKLANAAGWSGSDQALISYLCDGQVRTYGADDGILSMRDDILRDGRSVAGARMVSFYGGRKGIKQGRSFLPHFPSMQQRFPWIQEHWR